MNKKLIRRIVATVMACASVSALTVVGCSKPAAHTHTAESTWQSDENKHWHLCTAGDGAILDEGNHVYDNDQDANCNICGYERQVTPPTPTDIAVTGVELNAATASLKMGETESVTLTATVAPADATNKAVSWSSNNEAVATVANGVVTAVSAGTATITVTTEDGNKTASCVVTVAAADPVTPPVDPSYTTGIHTLTFEADADIFTSSINPSSTDSGYNSTYFKVATGDYLYANMKLQTNKIIRVSGKAVTSNKTTAGKYSNLGVSLTAESTGAVSGLPEPINFTQEEGEKEFSFELTVTTEGEIVLAFTRSSGSTGCEITELVIEIVAPGPVAVESVSLNKTTSALKVGETETLEATVSPAGADNTSVTWSTSDATIATVANGVVTALKAGTVTITATSAGDSTKTASCTYTITNVAVTGISFASSGTKIAVGGTVTVTPIFTPANATIQTVTWLTSNGAVATVADGVITGVAEGTATITATSTDGGFTATYTVEVLAEIVNVEGVAFATATGTLNTETAEQTVQLNPVFTPANATNKNVTWTSDNPTVASVDSNGLVTAHKKSGTAVITVTTEDGGKTATYTLTVEGPAVTANTPVLSKVSADELETAYVEWTVGDTSGVWFNVYYKADAASAWTKLDDELVRQYSEYYRADMVGLKAGTYAMKIVPTADGVEVSGVETIANNITVRAHDRSGYAFEDGHTPGAYKADGTLKDNAIVVYVTNKNKNSVTVGINVEGKGNVDCVGVQNIITGYKKGNETRPISIRLIGNITDPANMPKGDLYIDSVTSAGMTIEGIGNDATANGWGIVIKGSNDVEIRNLGVMNVDSNEGDDIGLQQDNSYCWIHNNDLFYGMAGGEDDQAKGDGALDTKKSHHITHSYNHFWDNGKCNLQGGTSSDTSNYITYHHNWYDHSDSRHPRVRRATVHVYNNYFDGNAKYGVGSTLDSDIFVENNYFRSTSTLRPMMISGQGTDAIGEGTFSGEAGGMIKAYGNVYDTTGGGRLALITHKDSATGFDCYEASSRDEQVPSSYTALDGGAGYNNFDTASGFYSYTPDTAEQAKANCERYAGRIDGGDFKWGFNNTVDDPDYGVNTALKSALASYTEKVMKIGNVSTGSSGGGTSGGSTGGGSETPTDPETPTEPETPETPVEGEITFIPFGSSVSGFTVTGTAKSHDAITVGGISIPKNGALKLNSSGMVTFTTAEAMTMTLYLLNSNSIKVDGTEQTVTAEGNYYVYTVTIAAGSHTIAKGGSENSLYAIKLTPAA